MRAVALTIAGSDPSGGAGIQADLKTFHQFGVFGEAVITLLTVQNTLGVSRVELLKPALVSEQADAVFRDIPPVAIKTGALGSAEIVRAVTALARLHPVPLVVDPVMVSKHGHRLLSGEAEAALKKQLFPCARLITPNIPEAAALTGLTISTEEQMTAAAEALLATGVEAVLVKGGHRDGEPVDVLLDRHGKTVFEGRRVETKHTHGTGCTYSAAITAGLALGYELRAAIKQAKSFVQRAIESAPGLGGGQGPVNHFAEVR